jgi:hypothetical protein
MKIPNGDLGLPVVFELHEWRLSVVRTPLSAANTCHGRFARAIQPPTTCFTVLLIHTEKLFFAAR